MPLRVPWHRIPLLLLTVYPFVAGCSNTGNGVVPPSDSSAPDPVPAHVSSVAERIQLAELGPETGLSLRTTSGGVPTQYIAEVNGSGLGLIDIDNDGDLDLFVANGATLNDIEHGPGCRLYENVGGMAFKDVTSASGIDVTRWAMGVAIGDYDGDRYDDIYITCFGSNVLLRNRGDGTFENVTGLSGVGDERWGTSAAFGDLDGDGDLDLYVVNYLYFDPANRPRRATYKGTAVMGGPHGLTPVNDIVYENLGDGTFRDATVDWGFVPHRSSFGLNLVIIDVNRDGHQDVYVANDSMPNYLFMNNGDGAFNERAMLSFVAGNADGSMQASMGIAVGDVDGNGYPDFFSTNFSSDTNTLHMNAGGRIFDDRTQSFGLGLVSRAFLGWGCGFFDLDHDGDEDLLLFNGHVYPEATRESMDSDYEQTPLLFSRDGDRFVRVESSPDNTWLDRRHRDRAAVFGDLDGDGDIDVIVSELNGPVRVLRNDTNGPDWLMVSVHDDRDDAANHRGLGSRIELITGKTRVTRWIYSGAAFQSTSAPTAHFAAPGRPASRVEVTWPDGHVQAVDAVWGSHLVVRRVAD